jgi:DNA-directed RNA polymerase specialized sigma24 family protein
VYDEEDVALSAFASFCRAVQEGRYPELDGRDGLWQLLITFTLRKARDRARLAWAAKRSAPTQAEEDTPLEEVPDPSPSPDLLALFNDECRHLFSLLGDPELEAVALWKLEGSTNEEIAGRLGSTVRTVQRMLAEIRHTWEETE